MAVRLRIRRATAKDAPGILAIYNDAVAKTIATFDTEPKSLAHRRRWLADHSKKKYPVLVALENGKVVGWASLSQWSDRRAYSGTVENSVYIAEDARGRGIGTALLRALMSEGRERKLHTIVARISDGNAASVRLHKKFGFVKTGVMREVGRKFGRLLDVHVMQAFISRRR